QRYSLQKAQVEEIIKTNHEKGYRTGAEYHQPTTQAPQSAQRSPSGQPTSPHAPLRAPLPGLSQPGQQSASDDSSQPKKRKRTRSRRKKREGTAPETFLTSQIIQPTNQQSGNLTNDNTINLR
ncbi:MAG: hypothetical protein AAB624_01030, partial [Patescibacteria group bacterium]